MEREITRERKTLRKKGRQRDGVYKRGRGEEIERGRERMGYRG